MGRKAIEVNKDELVKTINEFEAKQSWANPTELYKAIAKTDWAKNLKLNPSTIYLRVRDWKIELKTKKGKRGNFKLSNKGVGVAAPRKTRAEKFSGNPLFDTNLEELDKNTPKRYKPLCKLIKSGSMTAAVKLNCLDCMQYQVAEIRDCEVYQCPLWLFRPYQKGVENEELCSEEESPIEREVVL